MRYLACFLSLTFIVMGCHMDMPEIVVDFTGASDKGTVTFTNNSKGADSFVWDFGDGSALNHEASPTHQYATSGNFKVRLLAMGNSGTVGTEKSITVNTAVARGFDKLWDQTYGGAEDDRLKAMAKTSDGGAVLVGRSSSPSNGKTDFRVIRINSSGDVVWDKNFGGTDDDEANCILQVSDGYLIGGSSKSGSGAAKSAGSYGDYDYWLVKINDSGVKQWDKNYGGSSVDFMSCIIQSPDGTFLLGGSSSSLLGIGKITPNSLNGPDFWVVKVDANGNYKSDFGWGKGGQTYMTTMTVTSDNNILLSGYSNAAQYDAAVLGGYDFWSVRVTQAGAKIKDYRFGGGGDDQAAASLDDGRTTVGGTSNSVDIASSNTKLSPNRGGYDFLACRFDNSGAETWRRTYGGNLDDKLYGLLSINNKSNLLMCGESASAVSGTKSAPNYGGIDGWVFKTDVSGNSLTDDSFGGTGTDRIVSMIELSTGNYLLAGESDSPANTGNKSGAARGKLDFWVVRIKER